MSSEEEIEFASLFAASPYGKSAKSETRMKAERRAAMTEKQRSRGGRARGVQMNLDVPRLSRPSLWRCRITWMFPQLTCSRKPSRC